MQYFIVLTPEAISDIQKAIDYYDSKQIGLGRKFERHLDEYISSISKNPNYQIRYDSVHCLPLKKFPYMIHFMIQGEFIRIISVFHTSIDPDTNWTKRK